MSVDFYVWAGPRFTAQEFAALLPSLERPGAEAKSFQRSDRLIRWHASTLHRYPAADGRQAGSVSPWAFPPPASPYVVELNLNPKATKDGPDILASAAFAGLFIYDPQGGTVLRPGPARWQIWLRKVGLWRLAGPDP